MGVSPSFGMKISYTYVCMCVCVCVCVCAWVCMYICVCASVCVLFYQLCNEGKSKNIMELADCVLEWKKQRLSRFYMCIITLDVIYIYIYDNNDRSYFEKQKWRYDFQE